MQQIKLSVLCFALMLSVSGCADLIGEMPTIAALPTLTPSPVFTNTPAISELNTPTPITPTLTPTITLTLPYTSTPLIHASSTLSQDEMTGGYSDTVAGPKPRIGYFVAFPAEAGPGESVLLFWSSDGGTSASITRINSDGSRGRAWQVDTEGSLTVTLRGDARHEEYMLSVTNGIATVQKHTLVTVTCKVGWFFQPPPEEYCPAAEPVSVQASAQEFERGRMFWLGDTNQIIVLFNDAPQDPNAAKPAWLMVANPWAEGMPEDDPSYVPPEGLKQPRRGFGLVWRDTSGLADRIGWAINDEVPFNMTYQKTPGDKPRLFFSDYLGKTIALEPDGKSWLSVGAVAGP
ncbi:MAG: hypothetical protein JXB07_04270 [Anaerolineae bacterium]|nr:hypothetical protein [Anaerolineae bacterium]